MNILIPMAGLGSRLKGKYDKEKPLIKVKDKELILHSLETLNIDGRFIFITRNYEDMSQNNELSSLLKTFQKESIEIKLNKPTNGAAETCFYAKDFSLLRYQSLFVLQDKALLLLLLFHLLRDLQSL